MRIKGTLERVPMAVHSCTTDDCTEFCACNYAEGNEPPHYPVPAIPLTVQYLANVGLINGVHIRDNNGWRVAGMYADTMQWEYMPRQQGQCATCGEYADCAKHCPMGF